MKNYSFKKGFTLAEVLITLAIVGIVAAMTIPTLVRAYKKKMIETKLRNTIATITEVLRRIEADEGDINYWSKDTIDYTNQLSMQRQFANKYIMKYLSSNARLCGKTDSEKGRDCLYKAVVNGQETTKFNEYVDDRRINKIVLPDGTGFWIMYPSAGNATAYGWQVNIDLNVSKDKMYNGIDYFQFRLIKNKSQNTYYITSVKKSNGVYLPVCSKDVLNYPDGKVLNYAQLCENNAMDDNYYGYPTSFCSVMIECNDWKIPEDYPIKF